MKKQLLMAAALIIASVSSGYSTATQVNDMLDNTTDVMMISALNTFGATTEDDWKELADNITANLGGNKYSITQSTENINNLLGDNASYTTIRTEAATINPLVTANNNIEAVPTIAANSPDDNNLDYFGNYGRLLFNKIVLGVHLASSAGVTNVHGAGNDANNQADEYIALYNRIVAPTTPVTALTLNYDNHFRIDIFARWFLAADIN